MGRQAETLEELKRVIDQRFPSVPIMVRHFFPAKLE